MQRNSRYPSFEYPEQRSWCSIKVGHVTTAIGCECGHVTPPPRAPSRESKMAVWRLQSSACFATFEPNFRRRPPQEALWGHPRRHHGWPRVSRVHFDRAQEHQPRGTPQHASQGPGAMPSLTAIGVWTHFVRIMLAFLGPGLSYHAPFYNPLVVRLIVYKLWAELTPGSCILCCWLILVLITWWRAFCRSLSLLNFQTRTHSTFSQILMPIHSKCLWPLQ